MRISERQQSHNSTSIRCSRPPELEKNQIVKSVSSNVTHTRHIQNFDFKEEIKYPFLLNKMLNLLLLREKVGSKFVS